MYELVVIPITQSSVAIAPYGMTHLFIDYAFVEKNLSVPQAFWSAIGPAVAVSEGGPATDTLW